MQGRVCSLQAKRKKIPIHDRRLLIEHEEITNLLVLLVEVRFVHYAALMRQLLCWCIEQKPVNDLFRFMTDHVQVDRACKHISDYLHIPTWTDYLLRISYSASLPKHENSLRIDKFIAIIKISPYGTDVTPLYWSRNVVWPAKFKVTWHKNYDKYKKIRPGQI